MSAAPAPVRIHPDDAAFLNSRMSDASVAAILGRTLAWVQRARAWLGAEREPVAAPAPPPEAPEPPVPAMAPAVVEAEPKPAPETRVGEPPKPRCCGARQAVHAALLAGADADGIVVMNRVAMCAPGGVSVSSMQKIVGALVAADLLEQVRPGAGLRDPVWRVFAEPTPAHARPPLPPVPAPVAAPQRTKSSPRAPRISGASARPATALVASRTTRLKPLTDNIIRWASLYAAKGVDLDFLAFCFDVDEAQLAQAVRA